MSIEIRAGYPCPHMVVEERAALGVDKMSIPIRAPVAVAGSVRVLVNDSHYVPSGGLYSQAALTAAFSGPYNIQKCTDLLGPKGNVIRIRTSADTTDVVIPTGSRVDAGAVIRAIRGSGSKVSVGLSETNSLVLVDGNEVGTKSFVRVSRADEGVEDIVRADAGDEANAGERGVEDPGRTVPPV